MRSVLLGTNAFPPIIRLYMEMFKVWQDEVDELIIAVDTWSEPSTRDWVINLIKKFPKARLMEGTKGWPNSYTDAYKQSKADTFLIMHDDTLVHKKSVVTKHFEMAESGAVAVPFHGTYEPKELVDKAISKKYGGLNLSSYSFLLYFLFISREDLEKTSIDFNGIGWQKGDNIPLLGIKDAPQSIAGDTGWIIALELFEKFVPFYSIPRSETAGLGGKNIISELIEMMKDKKGIFGNGWLHLQNTGNTIPLWFKEDIDARKWNLEHEEVRLAWLYEMMQTDTYEEIPEFKKRMHDIFNVIVLKCGADIDRIKTLSNIFHILLYK